MAEFKIAEGVVSVEGEIDHNQIRTLARIAGGMAAAAFGQGAATVSARASREFFRRMFTPDMEMVRILRTGIPSVLGSPIGSAGIALGVLFASSFVGAVLSSGAFLLIGSGFIGIAAAAAAQSEVIQRVYTNLGTRIKEGFAEAGQSMVSTFTVAAGMLDRIFQIHIRGPLEQIFRGIEPVILPMVEATGRAIGKLMRTLASQDFMGPLRSFFLDIADELPRLSDAVGGFFKKLSGQSALAAGGFSLIVSAIEVLLNLVADGIGILAQMALGFQDIWREAQPFIQPLVDAIGALIGFMTDLHAITPLVAAAFATFAVGALKAKTAAAALSFTMGPLGILFGTIGLAMSAFAAGADEAEQSMSSLASAIAAHNREMVAAELETAGLLSRFTDLGFSAKDVVDMFLAGDEGFDRLRRQLESIVAAGTEVVELNWTDADNTTRTVMSNQAKAAAVLIEELDKIAPVTEEAQAAQERIAAAMGTATLNFVDQTEALEDFIAAWADGIDEFGDSVGTYEELLQAAEDKERERAQAVADATESSTDSWEDHVNDVSVSIDELIAKQDEQISAMENWATNIALLAAQGIDQGLIQELIDAGPKSAALVQTLVDAPADKREEYVENWARTGSAGAAGLADRLTAAIPALGRIASASGSKVASNIANAISKGRKLSVDQVVRLMNSVESEVEGRELLAAIEPLLDRQALAAANAALNNAARSRTAYINVKTYGNLEFGHGGIVGANRAQGGGPRMSRALVGEFGPEVVDLPVGSRVIPSVAQATDRNQVPQTTGGPVVAVIRPEDLHELARMFSRMLNGVTVVIDDSNRGRLQAREAYALGRTG